jgi:hypothetical protein
MANRILTADELKSAHALLTEIRKKLELLAGGILSCCSPIAGKS